MPKRMLKGGAYVTRGPWNEGIPFTVPRVNNWDNFTVDAFGTPIDPLYLPATVEVGGHGTGLPLVVPNVNSALMLGYRVRAYTLSMTGMTSGSGDSAVTFPDEELEMKSSRDFDEVQLLQDMQDATVLNDRTHAPTMATVGVNVSARISGFFVESPVSGPVGNCFVDAFVSCPAGSTRQVIDPAHVLPPLEAAGVECKIVLPGVGEFPLILYGEGTGSIIMTATLWWGFKGRYSTSDGSPL